MPKHCGKGRNLTPQMEPENDNFQKDDPVPGGLVSGSMLVFFFF